MIAVKADTPPVAETEHRSTFFRQSGWLMIANVGSGILMWAVHLLSKFIPESEYGQFGVFLAVAMCIPNMPLQMAMAHQTALTLANQRERQLAGMIRMVLLGTFILWLIGCGVVFCFHGALIGHWKITHAAALWLILPVMLLSLWFPLFTGVLQGQQNFLWMGWAAILNGVGRLGLAGVAVWALTIWALGGFAAGMVAGVAMGLTVAVGISAWQCRSLWLAAPLPFDWRGLLREVVPPMLGFGAFQLLFTADTMFVKSYFSPDDAGFYVSAGTLSRALLWLVTPLAAVMFPRIVHSAAKAEKTDLMRLVLIGTGVLAAGGALGLSILGPWVVRFVFKPSYVHVAAGVLPWYAAAMVPLAMANVLLNNLMARAMHKVVPVLCAIAIGYAFALTRPGFHESLFTVLKTLGVFSSLSFLACAWFTWRGKPQQAVAA
jgi:O-antigen/teichoic acid export membrane protein